MPVGLFGGALAVDVWYETTSGAKLRAKELWTTLPDGSFRQIFASALATFAATAYPSTFESSSNSASRGQGGVGASYFDIPYFASASGGSGGYVYAWSRIAQATDLTTATGTDTSSLVLHASWPLDAVRYYSERWRVTVTDSSGATGTADVTFYFEVAPER